MNPTRPLLRQRLTATARLALCCGLLMHASSVQAQLYHIQELGTLGGSESAALALNASGSIVGWSRTSTGQVHAFRWIPDADFSLTSATAVGFMEDLIPGTSTSVAYGINAFREVVGTMTAPFGQPHGFLRTRDGVLVDLSSVTPQLASAAFGINDIDLIPHVAGSRTLRDGRIHAFRLSEGPGPAFDLIFSDLGMDTVALGINNSDQVAGTRYSFDAFGRQQHSSAFRWSRSGSVSLNPPGGGDSEGLAINAAGQVVGRVRTVDGETHAFLWTRAQMQDLQTLGGGFSEAFAMNDLGEVVGASTTSAGARHAFLYTNALELFIDLFGPTDLNDLIDPDDVPATQTWELEEARGINDGGWIVGSGRHNGQLRAFLLQPVGGDALPSAPEGADNGSRGPVLGAFGGLTLPKTRIAVFRPGTAEWLIRNLAGKLFRVQWGRSGDTPVPADYLGTGKAQIAVFRPSTAEWLLRQDDGTPLASIQFGQPNDIPVPAPYLPPPSLQTPQSARIAVFRPATAEWLIRRLDRSTLGPIPFGRANDIPVPADYLGTGNAQIAVFRPATAEWLIRGEDGSTIGPIRFGQPGDIPVPFYYSGPLAVQIAVFRPQTAEWFIRSGDLSSAGGTIGPITFGQPNDRPVPGAYSGTDREQIAVFHPATAEWTIRTDDGLKLAPISWGQPGDRPVPAAYLAR